MSSVLCPHCHKTVPWSDSPSGPPTCPLCHCPLTDPAGTRFTGGAAVPPRTAGLEFLAPARAQGELGWLGKYRVRRVLGQGGMGAPPRAEDTRPRRQVALKVLRPEGARQPGLRLRFQREADALAALTDD